MSENHLENQRNEAALISAQQWVEDFTTISKDKLVRGDTPADIEARCLSLVQSYIGGSWANATSPADITVQRISGGFTNQLYHVQLKESVPRAANPVYQDEEEPTEVAIKLYQSKHMKTYHADDPERLNDTVVLNVMSQTGLGPKVYGIFADGFIQAYHRHEQLRARHQADPALRRQLMLLLAKIAHLQVPIRKTANVVLETAGEYVAYGYEHFQVQALAEELNLAHLKVTDIRAEHRELMGKIRQLNGPLVFSHYDFRGNNLMVVTNEKENGNKKILSVDLEFACYGTRGYDLACIFLESGQAEFLDMASPPPTDETLQEYVRLYIEACEEVVPGYSKLEINSFEQHLKEARLMVLANKLFLVAFLIGQREALIATVPLDRKKNLVRIGIFYCYIILYTLY